MRYFIFGLLFFFQLPLYAQISPAPVIVDEAKLKPNFTGVVIQNYSNGSPKLWKEVANGKANGLWLEWYPNGQLRYRAYWKNNLGNGKWEYFWPNGQLRSESFYIDDIAQGLYKSYHSNGQLHMDIVFMNGAKSGEEFIYDTSGQLLERKYYEEGQQAIDQPLVFEPGLFSGSNSNEWGISFTPDGATAYFTRRDLASGEKRIYRSSKSDNGWSAPEIASFSTAEDEAAYLSPDGERLYFASFRPLPKQKAPQPYDSNIWYVEKMGSAWSVAKPVAGAINTQMSSDSSWPAHYEAGPAVDAEGNLYYWAKSSETNVANIYFARRNSNGSFSAPVELIEPSSNRHFDSAPALSPDGKLLIFASEGRAESYGGTDLFYSRKVDGKWSKPMSMGPVLNSSRYDSFPGFSPDGKYFYFSSDRSGEVDAAGENIWNIYYMETRFLNIL